MRDFFKPGMALIHPSEAWRRRAPAPVHVLFTGRTGGVSSGPWGGASGIMGLNVALHVGDMPACVRMNRRIVSELVPSEPRWITQVHGTDVVEAEKAATDGSTEADASVSTTPGAVAVVMVADCLPVLLCDEKGRAVAAVHAGWRPLARGVIQKTLAVLRARTSPDAKFIAWLGPRIGPEAFEVGGDVLDAMVSGLGERAREAFRAEKEGKYLCDLASLARMALEKEGVDPGDIFDCGLSTAADPESFYSFRRDGARSGRHAAMIWLSPR